MRDAAAGDDQLSLGAALRQATAVLRAAGIAGAGDDARRLLCAVLGLSAAQILARPERPMGSGDAETFSRCIARRVAREPVSRILGEREFYGRTFAVSPATLDPRPDSETLIGAVLELATSEGWRERPLRILDVGTGSGCLLLTLLAELPDASGVGTDTSATALSVARVNGQRTRRRSTARNGLQPMGSKAIGGTFDILVSNPPYIPTAEIAGLDPEVRCFDPPSALDGGVDGLRFFHHLAAEFQPSCHMAGPCSRWGTIRPMRLPRCSRLGDWKISDFFVMSPESDGVWPCGHGNKYMPRKPLDSCGVRARLRRVESSMHLAVVARWRR